MKKSIKQSTPGIARVFIVTAFLFGLLVSYGYFKFYGLDDNPWTVPGSFGDFIGGLGSLFALFIMAYAIMMQSKELSLQRDELTLQREELRGSREVFTQQKEIQEKQLELSEEFYVRNYLLNMITGMQALRTQAALININTDRMATQRDALKGEYYKSLQHFASYFYQLEEQRPSKYDVFAKSALLSDWSKTIKDDAPELIEACRLVDEYSS